MTVDVGPTVPRTRADLRYLLALDLAAHGVDRWRARYRFTDREAHRAWLRRRAQYWAHATDRPGLIRPVVASALARRVRRLGPSPDVAPAARHATMTDDQVRLARRLHDQGVLDVDAVADAFWVSRSTLLDGLGVDHLREDGRADVTPHAS